MLQLHLNFRIWLATPRKAESNCAPAVWYHQVNNKWLQGCEERIWGRRL